MKRCGVATVVLLAASVIVATQDRPLNQPPSGFVALFNGKDLTGWRGRKPNFDPAVERQLTKPELSALQAIWNTERDQHWRVDVAKGEIVSDGNNPHLATEQTYGLADGQPERRFRDLPARLSTGPDLGSLEPA
jgi:hypothetical protein